MKESGFRAGGRAQGILTDDQGMIYKKQHLPKVN